MIVGNKTKLRMLAQDDIPAYCALINDLRELGDYWPAFIRSPHNLAQEFAKDGLSNPNRRVMLVTDSDDRWIGEVAVRELSQEIAGQSISYRVLKSEDRGKGYMTEAVGLFCDWLFDASPVERLTILAVVGNEASKVVAERCGFQPEGVLRKGVFSRGRYRDTAIYSLLRSDRMSSEA